MEVDVNVWAVILATLSSMVVGSIWYMPGVLGKQWMVLTKVKMDRKMSSADAAKLYGGTIFASFITAYVLAYMAVLANSYLNNSMLQDTFMTAVLLWLGFTAARLWVHDSFEARPVKLTLINSAHELVTITVMALIIGVMV